jgi:hypothetical protein
MPFAQGVAESPMNSTSGRAVIHSVITSNR